jgi:hypothetical protein
LERWGRRLGWLETSPRVALDLAAHARRLDSERAEGELEHQARRLEKTVEEAVEWFEAHGYV